MFSQGLNLSISENSEGHKITISPHNPQKKGSPSSKFDAPISHSRLNLLQSLTPHWKATVTSKLRSKRHVQRS